MEVFVFFKTQDDFLMRDYASTHDFSSKREKMKNGTHFKWMPFFV